MKNIVIPEHLRFNGDLPGLEVAYKLDEMKPVKLKPVKNWPAVEFDGRPVTFRQSMLKALWQVRTGRLCPSNFHQQYITGQIESETSKAACLGNHFEFSAIGGQKQPDIHPELLTAKGSFATELQRAIDRGVIAGNWIKENFPGYTMQVQKKMGWGQFSGTTDAFLTGPRGDIIIIDLKYSGLVGENIYAAHDYVWELDPARPKYIGANRQTIVQVMFYSMLTRKLYKKKPRFIYLIGTTAAGATDDNFLYPVEMRISADQFNQFQHDLKADMEWLKNWLTAKKNYKQTAPAIDACKTCAALCKDRMVRRPLMKVEASW